MPEKGREITAVLGLGEVGRPLVAVLSKAHRVEGIDLPPRAVGGPVGFLHICYPAEIPDFEGETVGYIDRYQPRIVVIHSTVPVGTTRAVANRTRVPVVHSPVRGKHTRMEQELLHYVKFIGSDRLDVGTQTSAHFEQAGMKTKILGSPEGTELAKLTETTYFGLLIAFAQDVNRMSRASGVDYEDVASFFDEIGYLPRVRFFPGVIGGHCVIPNIALLAKRFPSELLAAITWSNELRKEEHSKDPGTS